MNGVAEALPRIFSSNSKTGGTLLLVRDKQSAAQGCYLLPENNGKEKAAGW